MAPFSCALCLSSNYVGDGMTTVFQQLQGVMWLVWGGLLVCALLSGVLRSASFKGWLGERKVKRWIAQDLDAQHYHAAHNVTLQLADGSTTQIDHVVVSRFGVFVLETKHMQGWIFGGEKQPTWTQSIFKHRTSFQNPLRQNWRHIKALEDVLQLPLQHLHSVVVFMGDCQFKTSMPAHVTQGRSGIRWIQSHTEVVLEDAEVARLVQALAHKRLQATRATHQAHVAQLQERLAQPRKKVMPSKVPVVRKEPFVARRSPALAPADIPPEAVDRTEVAVEVAQPSQEQCPSCSHGLVRRSLPDKHGAPQYFVRCGRFPHCRFSRMEEAVAA